MNKSLCGIEDDTLFSRCEIWRKNIWFLIQEYWNEHKKIFPFCLLSYIVSTDLVNLQIAQNGYHLQSLLTTYTQWSTERLCRNVQKNMGALNQLELAWEALFILISCDKDFSHIRNFSMPFYIDFYVHWVFASSPESFAYLSNN